MDLLAAIWKNMWYSNSRKVGEFHKDIKFPINAKQFITENELTKYLKAGGKFPEDANLEVEKFEAKPLGEGTSAYYSEICILDVTYKGESPGPTKVVAKFCPAVAKARITMDLFHMTETEMTFYNSKEDFGVVTPEIYFADYSAKTGNFFLLMEFVEGKIYKMGDEAYSLDEAKAVMRAFAKFHSTNFGPLKDSLKWIHLGNAPFLMLAVDSLKKAWSKFWKACEKVGIEVPPEIRALQGKIEANFKQLMDYSQHYSLFNCVTHYDTKPDNIILKDDGAGGKTVALIDWQGMLYQTAAVDVSYYLMLHPDHLRKEHKTELLKEYYQALESTGVLPAEATFEEFAEEVQLTFVGPLIKVIIVTSELNLNDENVMGVVALLCKKVIEGCQSEKFPEIFDKLLNGELLGHKRVAAAKQAEKEASKEASDAPKSPGDSEKRVSIG